MVSSSSIAPLVPVRYTHPPTSNDMDGSATDGTMYAEVDEMQRLRAKETVKQPVPMP